MDGSQGWVAPGTQGSAHFPSAVDPLGGLFAGVSGLSVRRSDELNSIILTKTVPGLGKDAIAALRSMLHEIAAGRLGAVKFLVLDFAHEGFALSTADDGAEALFDEMENLILAAPVVSVASIRANLAGADLELALTCSMMVARPDVRFSFAADPLVSIRAYAMLAQKIGFVRTERLMEDGRIVDVEEMRGLYLLKDILEEDGMGGLEIFLRKTIRKHNACYGIYRARRIASPSVSQALRGGRSA